MLIANNQSQDGAAPDVNLSKMRMFFDECFEGEESFPSKDPALATVIERSRQELKSMFDVDDLSIIERAWLRHITIATIREYDRQMDLVTAGEIDAMNAIPTPPFSEVAARWVEELYRTDFLSRGEARNWGLEGGVSKQFKEELRVLRSLAHKI